MRSIIWYIHFVVSIVLLSPAMLRFKKLRDSMEPKEFERQAEAYIRKWARSQVEWSGARIDVTGNENIPEDEAVLFIANHQSNFDIGVFLGYINGVKGFLAKVEIKKFPLVRTWMSFINCVFIDRGDMRKSAEAILESIKMLKNGKSMVLFPEGTRSKGGKMGEFKAGGFKLATKTGVCVVPVTIDGTYKILEANGGIGIKPAEVRVTVHKPIYTRDMTKEELAALPGRVEAIIRSANPDS